MIFLDIYESEEMERLMAQTTQVTRLSLNSMGYADVLFYAHDGHKVQIEIKQAGELLSSLEDCEDQLRRQYGMAEESMLLVRGMVVPAVDGVEIFGQTRGQIFHKLKKFKGTSYAGYRSWLYSLDKAGITVYEVPNLIAAVTAIVAVYKNSQKAEHSTLQRYIKPKIYLQERNPYILTMMGLVGTNLGEKRSKELMRVYGSPWGTFCADPREVALVEGMGPILANKLIQSIGRTM